MKQMFLVFILFLTLTTFFQSATVSSDKPTQDSEELSVALK